MNKKTALMVVHQPRSSTGDVGIKFLTFTNDQELKGYFRQLSRVTWYSIGGGLPFMILLMSKKVIFSQKTNNLIYIHHYI